MKTQYILEMVECIAVACGAGGWIWRHQSLLLPHFRSNVVTHDDIARFQKVKKVTRQVPTIVPTFKVNSWENFVSRVTIWGNLEIRTFPADSTSV